MGTATGDMVTEIEEVAKTEEQTLELGIIRLKQVFGMLEGGVLIPSQIIIC